MSHEVKLDEFYDDPAAERSWALRMMMDGWNCTTDYPECRDYDRLKKLLAEVIEKKN
jgi:hypothetical protein